MWEAKVERTRKGSEKQREVWLQKEIDTLDSLKELMSGLEQVIRVLREEVESNEVLQMAQTEEIIRMEERNKELAQMVNYATNAVRLQTTNNSISKMIIEQDLN